MLSEAAPMPKCRNCKTPLVFTPGWKLGTAKNVHCPNPTCPTFMRAKTF